MCEYFLLTEFTFGFYQRNAKSIFGFEKPNLDFTKLKKRIRFVLIQEGTVL